MAGGLPPVLRVMTGTLVTHTDDTAVASAICAGFHYLLLREFSRQQPALSLLYDVEVTFGPSEPGSIRTPFEILIKIKDRVAKAIAKMTAAEMIMIALAIPPAFNEGGKIYGEVVRAAATTLQQEMPQYKPEFTVIESAPTKESRGRVFIVVPGDSEDKK